MGDLFVTIIVKTKFAYIFNDPCGHAGLQSSSLSVDLKLKTSMARSAETRMAISLVIPTTSLI